LSRSCQPGLPFPSIFGLCGRYGHPAHVFWLVFTAYAQGLPMVDYPTWALATMLASRRAGCRSLKLGFNGGAAVLAGFGWRG